MEKGLEKEQRGLLLDELARLQELARLVEAELILQFSSESCHLLLQEMLTAIDKSISLVKSSHPVVAGEFLRSSGKIHKKRYDPINIDDVYTRSSNLQKKICVFVGRKIMPKWTKEVRVDSGAADVGDGCSWRKYGQKGILGAKHPRSAANHRSHDWNFSVNCGARKQSDEKRWDFFHRSLCRCYFRCRHRATQGCPATKQVQRSDGDPLLFRVIYHGEHTCLPAAGQQRSRDLLSSFPTGIRVKTEGMVPTTPDNSNFGISRPSPTLPSPAAGGNSDVNWPSWDTDWILQELDFEADLSSLF